MIKREGSDDNKPDSFSYVHPLGIFLHVDSILTSRNIPYV